MTAEEEEARESNEEGDTEIDISLTPNVQDQGKKRGVV